MLHITQWIRQYTSFSPKDLEHAKTWIKTLRSSSIPRHEFDISYSRASGAGGQKVNKTSSKATVALDAAKWLTPQCYWIPSPIKAQLKEAKIRYQTKQGGLLIQSDASRNRDTNCNHCFEKLVTEIKQNIYFAGETKEEDIKKWDELAEVRKERIKKDKKMLSEKKKSRSKKFDI